MPDSLSDAADSVIAPARRCFVVTPHDSDRLPFITKALRAGGAGTIVLRAIDSDVDVAHPVKEGERLDIRATHVRATGTTVTVVGYA